MTRLYRLWNIHRYHGPWTEARHPQWRLQAATRRYKRRISQLVLRPYVPVVAFAACGVAALFLGFVYFKAWPPMTTLKHIAALPNCNAVRALGLAPAREGEPGYWPQHDRDNDGIACEPWPYR